MKTQNKQDSPELVAHMKEFEINAKEIYDEMTALAVRKQHDYGPKNILAYGLKGVIVRMGDKMARLDQLVWRRESSSVLEEKLEETYKDLANYCMISIMLLRNKWPKAGTELANK